MPFFWIKEGSNFVAIKFTKVSPEKVEETFASPATTDNVDTELLNYLKGMSVGEAIEIGSYKDNGLKTERSLKVRVGKHAKLANRELDWRKTPEGSFIIRVSSIAEEKAADNGTANGTSEVTVTDTPLQEEATTRGRGR